MIRYKIDCYRYIWLSLKMMTQSKNSELSISHIHSIFVTIEVNENITVYWNNIRKYCVNTRRSYIYVVWTLEYCLYVGIITAPAQLKYTSLASAGIIFTQVCIYLYNINHTCIVLLCFCNIAKSKRINIQACVCFCLNKLALNHFLENQV